MFLTDCVCLQTMRAALDVALLEAALLERMAPEETYVAAHDIEMQMRIETLEGEAAAAQASASAALKKVEKAEKKLRVMESALVIVREDKAEIIRSLGKFEAVSEAESEITARALSSCEKKLQKRKHEQLRLKQELAEARAHIPPGGLVGRRRHPALEADDHEHKATLLRSSTTNGPPLSLRAASSPVKVSSPRSWLTQAAENEMELEATIDELQFEKMTLEKQHTAASLKWSRNARRIFVQWRRSASRNRSPRERHYGDCDDRPARLRFLGPD